MSKSMKIGELAQQVGLSIRTLHYYDEIGLLSPSDRTEAGHRLYRDHDIIRLQRVISLQQLGFALKEIRECMENPDFALPQVIDLHRARLREQMALSRTLLDRLDAIATQLQTTQSIAVENLIQAMETITMTTQYFTPEQQAILEARFQKRAVEWQDLLTEIRAEMNRGTAVNDPTVQRLAGAWRANMASLIHGDRQIYQSFVKMYQHEGSETVGVGALDNATFEYISKAVSFLSLAEDMDFVVTFKRFNGEANQVITLGQQAIRELNFDFFGTEGMLLGLLAEGKSVAAQVLMDAGVSFGTTQQVIQEWLASSAVLPEEMPEQLGFAPRAYRVMELALEALNQSAAQQPSGPIRANPGHLLLGILLEAQEGGGVASKILTDIFGLDLIQLEQQLRTAMAL
ncbi:MAG: MerR family transcriptional regulator [Cyanobacteria bacterium P01_A01_bin.17]